MNATPATEISLRVARAKIPSRVRRRHARGVIFVEAVIIITTMMLIFMAVIFFRQVYVQKVRTQSLARAAAIAYSMGGCENNDPTAWAGRDLGGKTPSARSDDEQIPKDQSTPVTGEGSEKAAGIMRSLPATGSDDSFLNPIARVGLATEATVTTRDGALGQRRGFEQSITARSHQSCGDVVRDGDYGEIVDVVTGFFTDEDDEE
jgi:hypothetical protein